MKGFRIALVVVAALAVVILVVNLIAPAQLVIQEDIVVDAAPHEVYPIVSDFKSYAEWNPWRQQDPESTYEITGTEDREGYKYAWSGEVVGRGYLAYRDRIPYQRIDNDLVFYEPFEAVALDWWTFEEVEPGKTKVTWGHESEPSPFLLRFMNFVAAPQLKEDFRKGLQNVKQLAEYKTSADEV